MAPPIPPVVGVQMHVGVDQTRFLTDIYPQRVPAVIRGLDLGECTSKWTVDYLAQQLHDHEVVTHVSPVPQMDFVKKNFVYRSLPFPEFIRRVSSPGSLDSYFLHPDEKYYLRALGKDPRKDVADIKLQFPEIASDLRIPEFFREDQFYSSVFRIASSGVQLWTHYDVMDNILIQVSGRKKVVLYSPSEAMNLYLQGDKSHVLDVDSPDLSKYPLMKNAIRYECHLEPGDALFIPALWFHNVVSLDFGIAVNVFWRHLEPSLYDKKDVYGNRDPLPACRALQTLDKALQALDELPSEYRDFYARRMMLRIEEKALLTPGEGSQQLTM